MIQAATSHHRRELAAIGTAVGTDVKRITRQATSADIDAWFASEQANLQRITTTGFEASARLGANYLAQSAIEAGIESVTGIPPAVIDAVQVLTSLRVSGPVAFKTNIRTSRDPATALKVMTNRLIGSSQRLAMLGARSTINYAIDTGANGIIGYRRITSAGACKFCQMLAGRGEVYTSAASASTVVGRRGRPRGKQALGRPFHDNCRCTVQPIYGDGAAGELVDPTGRNLVARNAARAGRLERRARIDQARAAAAEQIERERVEALGRGKVDPELLAKWDVTEAQWKQAKTQVKQIKADIREVAKREADDLGNWLRNNDLDQITRPDRVRRTTDIFGRTRNVRDQSGYDFVEQLDLQEYHRLQKRYVPSDLYPPDLLAEQVRRKTTEDFTDDEAMNWLMDRWLHEDALRSVASGRIPRYFEPNKLIPAEFEMEGYQLDRLFGVDLDDAIGHVAQVQSEAAQTYAARTLGQPKGAPPWEMNAGDYAAELEQVEQVVSTTVVNAGYQVPQELRDAEDRLRELIPADLDIPPDANPYEIHETIRIVAQTAGYPAA